MRRFDLYRGCFYKHKTKGVCMFIELQGKGAYIKIPDSKDGRYEYCRWYELYPLEVSNDLLNYIFIRDTRIRNSSISVNRNDYTFCHLKRKGGPEDCKCNFKYVHELQLLLKIYNSIDKWFEIFVYYNVVEPKMHKQ